MKNRIEFETLKAIRELANKMIKEMVMPELYKQGLVSEDLEVDVRVHLRKRVTTKSVLEMMEIVEE